MGKGLITRRGGGAGEPTPPPSINFVSKTFNSITFTLTNNSVGSRDVTYGLTTPPDTTTIILSGGETSVNQTLTNLDALTNYIIYGQTEDSVITQLSITTDEQPLYINATGGTILEYNSGQTRYRSHTFTGNNNFIVTSLGNAAGGGSMVDYLIIAGGGGGGYDIGGGGGAGGYLTTITPTPGNTPVKPKIIVTNQNYSIVIGAGGVSNAGTLTQPGTIGQNSSALGEVAIGGGGGRSRNSSQSNGGSGGGGTYNGSGLLEARFPGIGISGQGFAGGTSPNTSPGSGGGGAGEIGKNAGSGSTSNAGNGGNGLPNILRSGVAETRGGGGGGGRWNGGSSIGGTGGGGNGDRGNGSVNTGGGGGGEQTIAPNTGGAGGSGIVIIRYEIAPN